MGSSGDFGKVKPKITFRFDSWATYIQAELSFGLSFLLDPMVGRVLPKSPCCQARYTVTSIPDTFQCSACAKTYPLSCVDVKLSAIDFTLWLSSHFDPLVAVLVATEIQAKCVAALDAFENPKPLKKGKLASRAYLLDRALKRVSGPLKTANFSETLDRQPEGSCP